MDEDLPVGTPKVGYPAVVDERTQFGDYFPQG